MSETFVLVLRNTLNLTNGGYCIDTTVNSKATYQINFDTLFNNRQRFYKKCQIRCSLKSSIKPNQFLQNTVGIVSLVGLGSNNTLGANGLPILPVLFPQSATFIGSTDTYFYTRGTLCNSNGVQLCSIPYGVQNIQVVFSDMVNAVLPSADIPDYELELYFEMYDEY